MKKITLFMLCLLMLPLIAYSQQTNATSDTTQTTLRRGHINNALDMLSGTNAGVTIGNNVNSDAMLTSVRIRGNSSLTGGSNPLVIIDGMSSDLSTLASIFPADIESVTVLKDAAQTALYGSRGAAGVIQVTTKRGQQGAFHIGYSGDVGFTHTYKYLSMLSADDYVKANQSLGLPYYDGSSSTDWQRSILRSGFVENHHIALGGGNKNTQYRASLSFAHNNSVVQTIGNHNLTAKLDVSQHAFNDHLLLDLGMFGSTQQNRYINDEQKLFYSAAAFNPTIQSGRTENGTWNGYSEASQINNPQSLLDILKHNDGLHFSTHMNAKVNIIDGLSVSAYASYSYAVQEESDFYPTYIESTGKIYRGQSKQKSWLANIHADYTKGWGSSNEHLLDANILAELQGIESTGFHTTVNMLASNKFGYHNIAIGSMRLWDGTGSLYQKQTLMSLLGHVGYTAFNKYSVAATLRADATSVVSPKHRWGLFPSASVSWNIKNEAWLSNAPWLSTLKLHADYGLSGNAAGIAPYSSLMLYEPIGVTDNDGVAQVVMGTTRNANQDLHWEKKHTVDVGVDFGIFSNRLIMHADYYYSRITDMIYNYSVPVPPFTYNTLLANLGMMENSGVEIGMGIVAVQTSDWDFNINLNLTYQQNRLLSLDGYYNNQYLTAPTYTPIASLNGAGLHGGYSNVTYQIVGETLGVFYLPHCNGLIQAEDGSMRYDIADLDGDGYIDLSDGGDRQVAGQATPKVLLGSNFSLRYKQFDLTMQLNGAFGHKIYNATALTYNNLGSLPHYNVSTEAQKLNINDLTVTDYWLQRGDYVNIDYLTLGWNMPIKPDFRLNQLRLSISVNNLATITSYKGLTPMINSSVLGSTLGVDDKNTFPVYRTYSFALNIQF